MKLEDGREGWVFGAFLRSQVDFAGLPVREAYGGPQPVEQQPATDPELPGKYTLYMTITDGQAAVSLDKFPVDTDIVLRLSVRGEGLVMTVATSRTDAEGKAFVTFEMPRVWADGSLITQNELRLTVTTVDGSQSRSASITYYPGP